jgi:hypothetical protein
MESAATAALWLYVVGQVIGLTLVGVFLALGVIAVFADAFGKKGRRR